MKEIKKFSLSLLGLIKDHFSLHENNTKIMAEKDQGEKFVITRKGLDYILERHTRRIENLIASLCTGWLMTTLLLAFLILLF